MMHLLSLLIKTTWKKCEEAAKDACGSIVSSWTSLRRFWRPRAGSTAFGFHLSRRPSQAMLRKCDSRSSRTNFRHYRTDGKRELGWTLDAGLRALATIL